MKEFENGGHNLDRLCGNRDALIGGLKTCNIASTNVPPQELIRWLYQLWNPNHPHLEGNWWDQDRPIAKQIVSSETEIRRYPRKLRVDGWHVQVKTPSFYAEEPDAYTSNMLVGDIKPANLRQIISPFMLTLNIEIVNVGKNIEQKSNIIMTQQGPLPNIAPKLKRKQSEFTKALGMIEDGKKFIQGFLTLVLFDKNPKRLDLSSSIASNIYEQNRYKLQDEYFYNLPLFIAAQPFGLYQPAIKDLGRMRPADTETFALMAPIQADWKGSPTPTLLYLSRRGQVNTLDLHDSDSNYNMVCCAQSGSGKSFNMNYITTNYLSRGGKSFIIDVGRSYTEACRRT
jgi:conjugal transfer ATP-binding protein TraC